ncbi:MAG: hypothetical protein GZ089_00700, partial [Aromatoleum sp.]|nr:hypothetical protein [Aromatoleum sp.]
MPLLDVIPARRAHGIVSTMADFHNHTYDQIAIGATETATRAITATEVEALALVAGEVDPFHLDG